MCGAGTTCTEWLPTRPAGRRKQNGYGGPPGRCGRRRQVLAGLMLQRSLAGLGFDPRWAALADALLTPLTGACDLEQALDRRALEREAAEREAAAALEASGLSDGSGDDADDDHHRKDKKKKKRKDKDKK